MTTFTKIIIPRLAICLIAYVVLASEVHGAMNDYVCVPPFISQSVPPLVMFEVGRDHKLYYQAYNDAVDLDGDGEIDYNYKHSINYYGYFDPYKCYTHTGGATGSSTNSAQFTPVSYSGDKFCASGQWSGNALNWITMSRMDALRKVLYGGTRSTDSNTQTVLKRAYVPNDAHSWGKELTGRLCFDGASTYTTTCVTDADCVTGNTCEDKSANLIGIAAAAAPSECASTVTAPAWAATNKTKTNTTGNILIAKYAHPGFSGTTTEDGNYTITTNPPPADCPSCPDQLVISNGVYDSFQPSSANFLDYYYISSFNYADTTAGCATSNTCKDVLPTLDHGDHHNFLAISEFNVANADKGNWQFFIDSDDAAELLIAPSSTPSTPPTLVARHQIYDAAASTGSIQVWNGLHSYCATAPGVACDSGQIGTVDLATSGYWRLIVRHSEKTGQDGVRVWYRKGTSGSWKMFGENGVGAGGVVGNTWLASDLTLRAPVISTTNKCSLYSPAVVDYGAPVVGTARRHLFCNTTLSDNGVPIMRLLKNDTHRLWEWAAKERPTCDTSLGTPIDYTVQVEVCKSGIGSLSDAYEYERCKNYSGAYKPIGLLQKYGEQSGASKFCSKSMAKDCTTDSDCTLATEGLCIYKSDMYFGMFTTSYDKNKSGGVLHKNIGSILDETNANNGIFQTSENVSGNIIISMDKMKILDFSYASQSYSNCGWITDRRMNEGECRDWGNPIAEMMYESLRYLAGAGSPTVAFTNGAATDAGLLKQPAWGKFGTGSATYKPYDIYPKCAKPFILLLSDVNTAFDSDQVPGSSFSSYPADMALPSLNVTSLANIIGTAEGIGSSNRFIGETSSFNDFMCTSKAVSNLSLIRGLCPEEPTKQGSFYSAAVAYYGKTLFKADTALPDVNTFAVALASPFNDLKIKVGNKFVTLVPAGKSVSGCLGVKAACADKCTLTKTADGLKISACSATAYCPTNTIVNVYVENIKYDASNNVIYAKFRINYEDVEQGADHDMDAIVSYEVCTHASENMTGTSCTTVLAADQLEVKVTSLSAAGCIDQMMGFVINGTTADATYLVVKDSDVGAGDTDTPAATVGTMPLAWQKTFTTNATGSTTSLLKNPLWYAAKWGGFQDKNGDAKPDLAAEWDKGNTGDPDNYFMVVNPLELERQLDRALTEILARTSSGTAASIVNKRQESGANLLTAVFHPKRVFENSEVSWAGDMHNYWFYFDPLFTNSGLREDTVADNELRLTQDYAVDISFDTSLNTTVASRSRFDGNETYTFVDKVASDNLNALWKAGDELFTRNTARKVYTNVTTPNFVGKNYSSNFSLFATSEAATLQPFLQATTVDQANTLISYSLGNDNPTSGAYAPVYRSRTVTYKGATRVWKLGDIINSTPKVLSSNPVNNYQVGYDDISYKNYINTAGYKARGAVFVGSNDGMFHAFRLGTVTALSVGDQRAKLTGASLGTEEWAFVPRNALPYLSYLADPSYEHIYSVDLTPTLVDASFNKPTGCSSANYWDCVRMPTDPAVTINLSDSGDRAKTSWRSIVIGGMGLGGSSRAANGACSSSSVISGITYPDCVKAPINSAGYYDVGMSSVFAIDVTDPVNPTLLWEFSDPGLGLAAFEPAIVRVNGKTGATVDPNTNGRWFAIFTSGPTGPIDTKTHQMYGRSDQKLKIYVIDMATGSLVRTFDTATETGVGLLNSANAFGGPLFSNAIDTDVEDLIDWKDKNLPGFYSTDVVYIGYTRQGYDTNGGGAYNWNVTSTGGGSQGGLLRLSTHEDTDPANWTLSTLIDGAGPVTSSIDRLYDKKDPETGKPSLWLYFGSGRYFYKDANIDDADVVRSLYGIKEPCYVQRTKTDGSKFWGIDPVCTTSITKSDLTDSSYIKGLTQEAYFGGKKGWFINMLPTESTFRAERNITTPIHRSSGMLTFTSFRPTGDVCSFGGETRTRFVSYNTGGLPPANSLKGKITIQLSTGAIVTMDLSKIFINAKVGDIMPSFSLGLGKPPSQPPQDDKPRKPIKKILHIQER
jgi:type IV pilus assembly protein PilY1